MENASQALVIAGGILLALLTLSLLVLMFTNINTIGEARAKQEEVRQIQEWNAEWEAYNKQYLYGADVLTVINKAEKNNIEEQYKVEVTVLLEDGTEGSKVDIQNNKVGIYRCTEMSIDNDTGRIKSIKYEFVK